MCNTLLEKIIDVDKFPADVICPSEFIYKAFFDLPRKRNLFLSKLLAPFRFQKRYYDAVNLLPYCENCPALLTEIKNATGDTLIFSGQEFYDFPRSFFRKIIKPSDQVKKRAEEILQSNIPDFSIQIRRTDHSNAIENSPLEEFVKVINQNADKTFFLATDDIKTKQIISESFTSRAVINPREADRNSQGGLIDVMAEILIMSQTERIYASYGSSFPEVASWLGNIPITVCRKKA